MFSVSSVEFKAPRKMLFGDEVGWLMDGRAIRDGERVAVSQDKPFNYTFRQTRSDGVVEKLTFIYHGRSVKPAMRTLRKYGADRLAPLVKALANLKVGDQAVPYITDMITDIVEDSVFDDGMFD